MSGDEIALSVLIASIGRESLPRTILTVHQSARLTGKSFEIIVADDGLTPKVSETLTRAGALFPEVEVILTGSRNISIARNALVEQSSGEYIAFVDDDEWVVPEWLDRHLAAMAASGADATFGPVTAHYPSDAPEWLRRSDPFTKVPGRHLSEVRIRSTANCLVRRSVFFGHDLRFKEALGRSGGEDTELFARLIRKGGRLVVAGDALVHEGIPVDRCSFRYIWQRSLRVGQTYAQAQLSSAGRAKRFVFFSRSLLNAGAAFAYSLVVLVVAPRRSLSVMMKAWRNLGKLREALKLPLVHYQ